MYEDILKHRLKELRSIKGLKQIEIASILGVDQSTYTNWETGKRVPKIDTLIKIADFYDVELDYLFGRDIHQLRKLKG